jgi:multiple sugar transport system permease protein
VNGLALIYNKDMLAAVGLLPAIVYVVVLVMSVQDYTVRSFHTGSAPFVGLANYGAVLANPLCATAAVNTVLFTVGSIVFQFGIGLAVFFNFPRRRRAV